MGDLILIGVMKAIHEPDLKVPGDVAVIGISNGFIPAMCKPLLLTQKPVALNQVNWLLSKCWPV